jgi:hypothetical protein
MKAKSTAWLVLLLMLRPPSSGGLLGLLASPGLRWSFSRSTFGAKKSSKQGHVQHVVAVRASQFWFGHKGLSRKRILCANRLYLICANCLCILVRLCTRSPKKGRAQIAGVHRSFPIMNSTAFWALPAALTISVLSFFSAPSQFSR